MQYCPVNLRTAPIEYYPNLVVPPVAPPFEKALEYIYSRFRCPHIHEGIERLHNLTIGGKTIQIGASLVDKLGNDGYAIDLLRILDWFSDITLKSLFAML